MPRYHMGGMPLVAAAPLARHRNMGVGGTTRNWAAGDAAGICATCGDTPREKKKKTRGGKERRDSRKRRGGRHSLSPASWSRRRVGINHSA